VSFKKDERRMSRGGNPRIRRRALLTNPTSREKQLQEIANYMLDKPTKTKSANRKVLTPSKYKKGTSSAFVGLSDF